MTEREKNLLYADLKELILKTDIWKFFEENLNISHSESEALLRTLPPEIVLGTESEEILEDYKKHIKPNIQTHGTTQYNNGEKADRA